MVGVAVNVTDEPAQIVVALAAILTTGTCKAFTVMVILLLVAPDGVAQVALLVSTQLTTSVLASAVVVYVLLFVPTLPPFTFHW